VQLHAQRAFYGGCYSRLPWCVKVEVELIPAEGKLAGVVNGCAVALPVKVRIKQENHGTGVSTYNYTSDYQMLGVEIFPF
jgi:hypothetical protein